MAYVGVRRYKEQLEQLFSIKKCFQCLWDNMQKQIVLLCSAK